MEAGPAGCALGASGKTGLDGQEVGSPKLGTGELAALEDGQLATRQRSGLEVRDSWLRTRGSRGSRL